MKEIFEMFDKYKRQHAYTARRMDRLTVTRHYLSATKNFPLIKCLRDYNNLQDEITCIECIKKIKKQVKELLIKKILLLY